ncbi:MAG TPA: hypothetical protein VD864_04750 [Nocardioides sp.]|nr:hypothetical protein [Nocardioides sp.]
MSIRVEAVARRLAALGTSASASGSDAQDAYRAALRTLKDAQKKLTADLAGKAPDDVLLADRLAIQVAQAELARAATALVGETVDTEQTSTGRSTIERAVATPATGRTSSIDLYA